MKKFMLFIREDVEASKQFSDEENQQYIQQMLTWVEALSKAGNFEKGDPLEPDLRISKHNEILHDGPFIESKEGISGYMIISADDIDAAAVLAQRCPLLGGVVKSIEVRPIMQY
jgi:hypothetical protein